MTTVPMNDSDPVTAKVNLRGHQRLQSGLHHQGAGGAGGAGLGQLQGWRRVPAVGANQARRVALPSYWTRDPIGH